VLCCLFVFIQFRKKKVVCLLFHFIQESFIMSIATSMSITSSTQSVSSTSPCFVLESKEKESKSTPYCHPQTAEECMEHIDTDWIVNSSPSQLDQIQCRTCWCVANVPSSLSSCECGYLYCKTCLEKQEKQECAFCKGPFKVCVLLFAVCYLLFAVCCLQMVIVNYLFV